MKNTEEQQIIKRLEKSKADIYFAVDKYLANLYNLEFLRSQLRAKDFNKRLLEDNKQFHKDIMESKREHNKLIMSMSSLTSELIKKAMS